MLLFVLLNELVCDVFLDLLWDLQAHELCPFAHLRGLLPFLGHRTEMSGVDLCEVLKYLLIWFLMSVDVFHGSLDLRQELLEGRKLAWELDNYSESGTM